MRGPKTIHKHRPGASLTWTQFMISLLLSSTKATKQTLHHANHQISYSFLQRTIKQFLKAPATESTSKESMKLSMISSNEILNHAVMEFCLVKNARITRNCCRRRHLAFTFDSNFTNACPRLQSRYQVR